MTPAPPTDLDLGAVRFGPDGLVPGVVQDATDGRVLMVGYLDSEALDATLATGEVHFHSRSRRRLWRKGETSGYVLRVRGLAVDCDGDALLISAEPSGPTCHRGTRSCFDADGPPDERTQQGFAWLETLWSTIEARAAERAEGSYTARLLAGGVDAVGRKLTEEATEVLLAAKDDAAAEAAGLDREETRRHLAEEAADLVYHALVVFSERGLEPASVIASLRGRHRSGRPAIESEGRS
ncbi:MAG TPA: bifunctional phosphoribosyl-AMP cyclohydrolase/phosphoribosyl-ATP diphosphatase HisIE [Candidatus Limnocylindrales bacterium]